MPLFRIRARRSDIDAATSPGWLPFQGVPAGRYRVSVRSSPVSRGAMTVTLGNTVLASFVLEPRSRKSAVIDLPDGAPELALHPDAGLAAGLPVVELVPEK